MTTPLALAQRDALAAHLLSRFHMKVREKDGLLMVATARVFDVAELFGANVPTGAAFSDRYWTTPGPVVFVPTGKSRHLGANLRILSHEITHGVKFWRNAAIFVGDYTTERGRAESEAEAERGAIEVAWLVDGAIPADVGNVDICRHGYAIESGPDEHDDAADLVVDLLEHAVASVKSGVLSTDVGEAAHRWMVANAPESIMGRIA